jgi:hypothetical protein
MKKKLSEIKARFLGKRKEPSAVHDVSALKRTRVLRAGPFGHPGPSSARAVPTLSPSVAVKEEPGESCASPISNIIQRDEV